MVLHFFKLLLSLLHLKPFRVYKNLWCSALNLYTLFPPKSADPLLQIWQIPFIVLYGRKTNLKHMISFVCYFLNRPRTLLFKLWVPFSKRTPLIPLIYSLLRKLSSNKDQSRKVENSSTTEFSNFEKSVALFKRHL